MPEGQEAKIMVPLFGPDRKTIEAQAAVNLSNPVNLIQMLRFGGSPHLVTGELIPKGDSVSIFYKREDTPNGLICYVRDKIKEEKEGKLIGREPYHVRVVGTFGEVSIEVVAYGKKIDELDGLLQGMKEFASEALTRDARDLAYVEAMLRIGLQRIITNPTVNSILHDIAKETLESRKKFLDGKSVPTEEHTPGYWEGLVEGFWLYAHWKDGVQYVGTGGKTLEQAYENANVPEEFRK